MKVTKEQFQRPHQSCMAGTDRDSHNFQGDIAHRSKVQHWRISLLGCTRTNYSPTPCRLCAHLCTRMTGKSSRLPCGSGHRTSSCGVSGSCVTGEHVADPTKTDAPFKPGI